jgi:death on curing protein
MNEQIYRDLPSRAAALLHSITRWEPLEMWNGGLGWRATNVLAQLNGAELEMPWKDRMILTAEITDGRVDSVADIAAFLAPFLRR